MGIYNKKCNLGHGEKSGHRSVMDEWLHGLRQRMVCSRALECSFQPNDEPICERVMASLNIIHGLTTCVNSTWSNS